MLIASMLERRSVALAEHGFQLLGSMPAVGHLRRSNLKGEGSKAYMHC